MSIPVCLKLSGFELSKPVGKEAMGAVAGFREAVNLLDKRQDSGMISDDQCAKNVCREFAEKSKCCPENAVHECAGDLWSFKRAPRHVAYSRIQRVQPQAAVEKGGGVTAPPGGRSGGRRAGLIDRPS
ncbi:hypothetical protein [Kushneria aurantia]|uniref:Uncharacterized protein n=1 Tax=Kushneria aurantia TaxID=504092 RepID=A0ABV6G6H4_9GAMM|nr:hypothetical protein [Kushneria aurantia]